MTFLMTVRTKASTSTRTTATTTRLLTIFHFYFQVPQLPDADASLESVDLSEDDRGQAGLEAFLAEVKRKKVIYVNKKKKNTIFTNKRGPKFSFFSFLFRIPATTTSVLFQKTTVYRNR